MDGDGESEGRVGGIKLIGRKDLFVFEGAGISCSIFFLGVYCVSRWKQG